LADTVNASAYWRRERAEKTICVQTNYNYKTEDNLRVLSAVVVGPIHPCCAERRRQTESVLQVCVATAAVAACSIDGRAVLAV